MERYVIFSNGVRVNLVESVQYLMDSISSSLIWKAAIVTAVRLNRISRIDVLPSCTADRLTTSQVLSL